MAGQTQGGGWTRVRTRTGRYEYQFQGRVPAVRKGQYEEARDYQFLVMDEEGWLYRIPVRINADAEEKLEKGSGRDVPAEGQPGFARTLQIAEAQLRAGLENYRPRQNAPYAELDQHFATDISRAQSLRVGLNG